MSNKPLYIDIHILQSVPPSNINRDDTGSPKTAKFGGVTRARVSSQAWKKATRDYSRRYLDGEAFGLRTKHAVDFIAEKAMSVDDSLSDENAYKEAKKILKTYLKKGKKDVLFETGDKEYETKALVFISKDEIRLLADCVLKLRKVNELRDSNFASDAIDIAMFGRMVATNIDLNIDASVQVAHAIGVSSAHTEFDYFTALDDKASEDNAGAAIIETTEFTSAMFYRYANVDVFHLCENLGSPIAAVKGIEAFLKSFVKSMPTGKQNSFANRTLPSAVVIQLRDSQPVSLVNAFECPVIASRGMSQLACAAEALVAQEKAIDMAFDTVPQRTFVVSVLPDTAVLGKLTDSEPMGLNDAVEQIVDLCGEYLSTCGFQDEERE